MAGVPLRRRRDRRRRSRPPARRPTTSCAPGCARWSPRCAPQGTTTVEVKSGYGLTVDDEARALRLAARGHRRRRRSSAPTWCRRAPTARRLRRARHRRRCSPPARRTPAGSTSSASRRRRTPSTATRPAPCSTAGRAAGLGLRVHANQLSAGPGVQLAVELGAASVDHCTHLTDADVDALAGGGRRSRPCCRASSSPPARPTPTPGGCSTPGRRSRSPPTATPAAASPRRCRSASRSPSARCG